MGICVDRYSPAKVNQDSEMKPTDFVSGASANNEASLQGGHIPAICLEFVSNGRLENTDLSNGVIPSPGNDSEVFPYSQCQNLILRKTQWDDTPEAFLVERISFTIAIPSSTVTPCRSIVS